MDCFENVIGLTNKDCECFTDKPEGAGDSVTGLVLDELDGMPLDFVTAAAECGEEGGLWSKMLLARKTAIKQTEIDLLACIAKNNVLNLRTWTGNIGQQGFKKELSINTAWAGIKLVTRKKKSSYIKINAVSLMINESGTFAVKVFNNVDDEELGSYNVNVLANRLSTHKISEPLLLPLFDDRCEALTYYFVYERGTAQPKDGGILCGTCGNNREEVDKYVQTMGVIGDTIDVFNDRVADPSGFKTTDSFSYGLSIGVSLECDQKEIICKNYNEDLNFRQYFGQSVLYKSAENLLNYVLNSGEISRYTQTEKEGLYGRRNSFRKEYVDHLSYLCGTIDLSKNDCFKCKQNMKVGKLIS